MKAGPPSGIGLLLAGSACLLPFLVPYHQQPFLSFFPEWLAVALGLAAALVMFAGRDPPTTLPAPARWLIALAVLLALRAAGADQAYPQLPLLAALYVLYAVLMIRLGAQLAAELGIERVAQVLAAFVLVGGLANAAAGVIQFYGRPALLEDLIAELHGWRAYGNIAQANLFANYLGLGEGALLFLWLRARARTGYALAALVLLASASALSGSRSALLYPLWYAAFALVAARAQDRADTRRLKFAAYAVACVALAANFAVPWLNGILRLGPPGDGTVDRLVVSAGAQAEPRWQAWLIALRIFADAPLAGTGSGGFAGAAFEAGLGPPLTYVGEVWTSPHNLPLHLLAETGGVGTALALGGLCIWGWRVAQDIRADPQPARWWLVAAAGVQLIHSLLEFPLWSANFLGVAALLIGASARAERRAASGSPAGRIAAATACAVLAVALGSVLKDYVRLDAARVTGTAVTLAPAAQARQDAATMRELRHGLLAPLAERWIVLGAPLDRDDLATKLAMSERVARNWPANAFVVRRAVFLALAGEPASARSLLERALRAFPHRREATIRILEQASAADPAALGALLAVARAEAPASK